MLWTEGPRGLELQRQGLCFRAGCPVCFAGCDPGSLAASWAAVDPLEVRIDAHTL